MEPPDLRPEHYVVVAVALWSAWMLTVVIIEKIVDRIQENRDE